jgi:polygalacturonase
MNAVSKISIDDFVVNVKQFGAKGDGVTDDTSAIRTAISTSPNGSKILFPPGTYIVGGNYDYENASTKVRYVIAIDNRKDLAFIGNGATIKYKTEVTPDNTAMLLYISNCQNMRFDGLYIDSNMNKSNWMYANYGIMFANCIQTTIEHCKFTNVGYALGFVLLNGNVNYEHQNKQALVNNCYFYHVGVGIQFAVYGIDFISITNCKFEKFNQALKPQNSIASGDKTHAKNFIISNCEFKEGIDSMPYGNSNLAPSVEIISDGYPTKITHCTFENCRGIGIYPANYDVSGELNDISIDFNSFNNIDSFAVEIATGKFQKYHTDVATLAKVADVGQYLTGYARNIIVDNNVIKGMVTGTNKIIFYDHSNDVDGTTVLTGYSFRHKFTNNIIDTENNDTAMICFYILGVTNLEIVNNIIHPQAPHKEGIFMKNCSNYRILDNYINNCIANELYNSDTGVINNNTIIVSLKNSKGLTLLNMITSTISQNKIKSNASNITGIYCSNSNLEIAGNWIYNENTTDKAVSSGSYINTCLSTDATSTISAVGNLFKNAITGINITNSNSKNYIKNNTFEDVNGLGIVLTNTTVGGYIEIVDNQFSLINSISAPYDTIKIQKKYMVLIMNNIVNNYVAGNTSFNLNENSNQQIINNVLYKEGSGWGIIS